VINTTAPARWDGVYFGGHVGANIAGSDFAANLPFLAFIAMEATLFFLSSKPSFHSFQTARWTKLRFQKVPEI